MLEALKAKEYEAYYADYVDELYADDPEVVVVDPLAPKTGPKDDESDGYYSEEENQAIHKCEYGGLLNWHDREGISYATKWALAENDNAQLDYMVSKGKLNFMWKQIYTARARSCQDKQAIWRTLRVAKDIGADVTLQAETE